ncbi:hypothetical protein FSARC_9755 [Fusarium sarcochroum]|uniref:Uncharacterized protein n=1 Tax=Fusarium sarcochroum TaxID=1208366 RepID=A0A8H4TQD0_9HYPO|nr:hypothetical protein FSARC_9755 [Fusarium sarcochroum]
MRKIKGGASTLERYHEQLQELQSISTCISQNPLLQTPEIGTQTEALLSIINNNCLNSLLQKGRFLRVWGLFYKEQDLLDIFVRLERQKSNLSLAIEQIQSKALYQIQTDIQNMADKKTPNSPTPDSPSRAMVGALVRGRASGPFSNSHPGPIDLQSINPWVAHLVSTYVPELSFNHFPNDASAVNIQAPFNSQGSSDKVPSLDDRPFHSSNQSNDPMPEASAGPQWNDMVAGPDTEQENGRNYSINGKLSKELSKDKSIQCIHNNPIKLGPGNQYNRNLVVFKGDDTDAVLPDMTGDRWNGGKLLPYPSSGPEAGILGRQFNGIEVRYEETGDASEQGK